MQLGQAARATPPGAWQAPGDDSEVIMKPRAIFADPFRGAFRVTPSSEQIILVRSLIDQSLCGPDAEQRPSVAVEAAAARQR